MTTAAAERPDPNLDLQMERLVDLPAEKIWAAWTRPELIKQWFTPAPWSTVDSEVDLRPGGIFRTVMRSPEGEEFPNLGCFLEVVENRRLVWTNALGPGYRPTSRPDDEGCDSFAFVATLLLEPEGNRTRYIARVVHGDEASRKRHEAMGFEEGWSKALEQLVALMKDRA